jgi:hypothetical protein
MDKILQESEMYLLDKNIEEIEKKIKILAKLNYRKDEDVKKLDQLFGGKNPEPTTKTKPKKKALLECIQMINLEKISEIKKIIAITNNIISNNNINQKLSKPIDKKRNIIIQKVIGYKDQYNRVVDKIIENNDETKNYLIKLLNNIGEVINILIKKKKVKIIRNYSDLNNIKKLK